MLVLERRSGQAVLIHNGNDVVEINVEVKKDGKVRLAIEAPGKYKILRKELADNKS